MEHYRQSVKDQREQDQRKHEHQVQQLQAEIRTLNQTLSVKQGDITQLNKDNGRLAAELGATQKTVAKLEAEQRKLITNLESKSAEVESLKTQLSELEKQSE
jgi:predicted nuclease with TOPRIM domain